MREDYPFMFSHPGCKPGEVWIGDQMLEFACINVQIYKRAGCPSARLGEDEVMVTVQLRNRKELFPGRSVFVNLKELIAYGEKQEKAQMG